jgi:hypothetical protein
VGESRLCMSLATFSFFVGAFSESRLGRPFFFSFFCGLRDN